MVVFWLILVTLKERTSCSSIRYQGAGIALLLLNSSQSKTMKDTPVTIIGGGLAGCEAAWQLATRHVAVILYDMKPAVFSPAHESADLAELVCSNS
ncbi:MAG: FAD-dependent oxidoreductase, partial [Desulfocapsaceae bacterium]|nr:FAD-dependent oxidoreductase [Desulfocapsaceae bacterium]